MPDLLDRLKTALADRYRVDREIGRGGMAHVFLAQDLKLDRPVALKVLRPDLAAVLGGERFLREITLAAKLEHPHILGIHDSGEADGVLYYVMPYVEGESLRGRLSREKQLPLDDALQIAREVADALSYAHARGVIHRDIKPENILLEAGHAVVADFGIARAIDAAGGDRLTETGVTLGTPTYMSPEQAGGSRDLDGRSDLYSLGCVLYEMLAGQPPFTGPTIESVVAQHLSARPPDVTNIRPSVPGWVVAALERSLAKTPADRFNPVAQFGEAIAPRISVTEPSVAPRPSARRWPWIAVTSVAVVIAAVAVGWEFQFRSGNSPPGPRPYTIVASLQGSAPAEVRSAVHRLIVTELDRSGAMQVLPDAQVALGLSRSGRPDTTTLIPPVAQELAVRGNIPTVVVGSLDRLGNSFSLAVRVLRAAGDTTIATVAGEAGGEDALIETVEQAVRSLRAQLGEQPAAIAQTKPLRFVATSSFAAVRRLDRGNEQDRVGDYVSAVKEYREALALDPGFASAWLSLGVSLWNTGDREAASHAFENALAHADRLNDNQRLNLDGLRAWDAGDLQAAVDAWTRLARETGGGRQNLGIVLDDLGRTAEAVQLLKEQERASPFGLAASGHYTMVGWLSTLGRYDEAWQRADSLSGAIRARAGMVIAAASAEWARADSLAATVLRDSRNQRWHRQAFAISAASSAARGRVRESQDWLRRLPVPGGLYAILVLHQASGTPLPAGMLTEIQADTASDAMTALALWAVAIGDTASARRRVSQVRGRLLEARRHLDGALDLAEAWSRTAPDRADDAVHLLAPLAARSTYAGPPINQLARWLLAAAYERAGQLDSAVAWFERIAEWREFWLPEQNLRGLTDSFARQRLVVLYAGMGRLDDARRHWKIFSGTFTQPDREVAHLVDEARAALEAAERKAG